MKKKNRNKEKNKAERLVSPGSKPNRPRNAFLRLTRVYIGAIAIMGILACIVLVLGRHFFYPKTPRWKYEQVITSPANTHQFMRDLVTDLRIYLPEDAPLVLPFGVRPSIRWRLEELLTGGFTGQFKRITEAEAMLHTGPKLSLTIIGDIHAEITSSGVSQDPRSVELQASITDAVKRSNAELAFVEGFGYCRLDPVGLRSELKKQAMRYSATVSPVDLDGIANDTSLRFWWKEFVDTDHPKLYGVDEVELQLLVLDLDQYADASRSEPVKLLRYWLNNLWREQIILAGIVRAMRTEKAVHGVLVIGEFHLQTLPKLCRQWGIECTIIQPTEAKR